MAKFKRYDSYKNSGVEWLGEIPSHWEIKKLRFVMNKIQTGSTPSTNTKMFFTGNLNWFNPKDLNQEILKESENKLSYLAIDRKQIKLFPKDSVLIVGIGATAGKTSYLSIDSTFNQQITGFHSDTQNNKFFFYVFSTLSSIFLKVANYTTLPILNNEFFKSLFLPLPPKDEQEKIASYLDEKIAKIDASISGKEKFIELLKEQKQIIINDAVTKGLNKNAKFKNSGVEWLGQIPSHWEILKLKFIGKIFAGLSDKKGGDFSKEFTNDKKPFIPFTNVCNNLKIDKNQMQYVKINPYETQNKVREKDIIFLMSSETLEDIGKCSIYLEKEQLYLNSFCKGFRPNLSRINAEFLNYLLQSKTYRNYFNLAGRGFTRINIKQEYISNLCAVLPPKDEQEKIVEYIENKISKIDKLLNLEQECIKSLKEYKASLIDSVVTGKVKV